MSQLLRFIYFSPPKSQEVNIELFPSSLTLYHCISKLQCLFLIKLIYYAINMKRLNAKRPGSNQIDCRLLKRLFLLPQFPTTPTRTLLIFIHLLSIKCVTILSSTIPPLLIRTQNRLITQSIERREDDGAQHHLRAHAAREPRQERCSSDRLAIQET
jgi:hypothetical protein